MLFTDDNHGLIFREMGGKRHGGYFISTGAEAGKGVSFLPDRGSGTKVIIPHVGGITAFLTGSRDVIYPFIGF